MSVLKFNLLETVVAATLLLLVMLIKHFCAICSLRRSMDKNARKFLSALDNPKAL